MRTETAPVAFFVFNRPSLTSQVFERIRAAQPKRLLLIADGPRSFRPEDAELCEATRKIIQSPDWPCEVLTNFANENLGCRRRVSSGLDWVFEHCSEAIILEDDCLPGASFFDFCSEMLRYYRDNPRIMHVSGDNFRGIGRRGEGSYFFSRYPFSWGWASWRRAWQHYDVNISSWPTAYREHWLESVLESPVEVQHWESILDSLYRGKIDTWDYQWLFACWRRNGLSILPNENLVTNIGVGPDALHFKDGHSTVGIPAFEIGEIAHPDTVARDNEADRLTFEKHIRVKEPNSGANWIERLRSHIAVRTRMRRLLPRALHYR